MIFRITENTKFEPCYQVRLCPNGIKIWAGMITVMKCDVMVHTYISIEIANPELLLNAILTKVDAREYVGARWKEHYS